MAIVFGGSASAQENTVKRSISYVFPWQLSHTKLIATISKGTGLSRRLLCVHSP